MRASTRLSEALMSMTAIAPLHAPPVAREAELYSQIRRPAIAVASRYSILMPASWITWHLLLMEIPLQRVRRARDQHKTFADGKPPEGLGLHRLGGRPVETLNDLGQGLGRREQAVPALGSVALHACFGDRRQVGKGRRTLCRRDCQRAQLPSLDQRGRARDRREHHLDLSAEQIGDGGRRALVGNGGEIDLGQRLEQFASEMRRRAGAIGAVGELFRVRFRGSDQIGNRTELRLRIHHNDVVRARDQGDGSKILVQLVGQFGIETRIDGVGESAHQKRIAIGLAGCDRLRADDGARPRLVLDDDGLAEILFHLLRQCACDHVGAATRRERHHDAHEPLGIGRVHLIDRPRQQRACCKREQKRASHEIDTKAHAMPIPEAQTFPMTHFSSPPCIRRRTPARHRQWSPERR
jgi:hypothetical protein